MIRTKRRQVEKPRERRVWSALFNLRPGDGLPLAILLGHSFLKGAARVLLETPTNSLFLARFSIGHLPLVYICTALVCTGIGLLYTRAETRVSVRTLLTATLCFVAVGTLAFYFALVALNSKPVVFGVMVWKDVHWTLMNLEFWALAGLLLDVRQGKRLFGLIALGEIVAGIAGGFSVPLFMKSGGTQTLVLASAGLTIANVFLLFYTMRLILKTNAEGVEAEKTFDREPWWTLFKDNYLALFFAVSALSIFGEYFIDYLFYENVERAFASEEKLTIFFGMFYGVLGVGQLISSAWISGRGLTRYGLSFGLLVLPGAALMTTGFATVTVILGTVAVALFWSIVAAKFLDEVGRHTIEMPAYRILYQPLAPDQRLRAQTVRESMVEPLSIGLVGAILWAGEKMLGITSAQILYLTVVIVIVWAVSCVLLRRKYTVRLVRALTSRRLDDVAGLSLDDSTGIPALEKGLQDGNAGQVTYCLDLLEESGHASLENWLTKLLDHPDALVRPHVLEKIERLNVRGALEAVTNRLQREESTAVRAAILQTICALSEAEGIERVVPFLDDPDLEVRQGALVGLLRHCGIDGVLAAGPHLTSLFTSPTPKERALAARILGDIGISSFHRPLLAFLRDSDIWVQMAAIDAARKLLAVSAIVPLIEALNIRSLRAAASDALAEIGDAALPALETAFTASDRSRPFRNSVALICGRIGSDRAATFLKTQLLRADEESRTQVLTALMRCHEHVGNGKMPEARALILREADEAAANLAACDDVLNDADLSQAYLGEVDEAKERIFMLLSLLYRPEVIRKARIDLEVNAGEKKAHALEVLDNLLAPELKRKIFPLLDNISPQERLRRLTALFPQTRLGRAGRLRQAVAENQAGAWTKSCALLVMGKSAWAGWSDAVIASLNVKDTVVRETAIWALSRVDPETFSRLAPSLRDDGNPIVARLLQEAA